MNDLGDRREDANHPPKPSRPIAAGEIHVPVAWKTGVLLLACGLILTSVSTSIVMEYSSSTAAILGAGLLLS